MRLTSRFDRRPPLLRQLIRWWCAIWLPARIPGRDAVLWFLAVVGVFHVGLYYGRPIGDALAALGWLR